MDIYAVTTMGYGISGGYTTEMINTVTLGYKIEDGDIQITDADAKKIATYVWNKKLDGIITAGALQVLLDDIYAQNVLILSRVGSGSGNGFIREKITNQMLMDKIIRMDIELRDLKKINRITKGNK